MKNFLPLLTIIILFLNFISVSARNISFQDVINLTINRETYLEMDRISGEIEDLKLKGIASWYQPRLRLIHLTYKPGGDYEFDPEVRYQNFRVPIEIDMLKTYETQLFLNQLVWDNNRTKLSKQIQKKNKQVVKYENEIYVNDQITRNLDIYFAMQAREKKKSLMEENLALVQKTIKVSEVQLSNGLITEIDLRLLQNKARELEVMIREESLKLESLRTALAERLGLEQVSAGSNGGSLPILQPESYYLSYARAKSPEIVLEEKGLEIVQDSIRLAHASKGPYIQMFSQFGLRSNDLKSSDAGWVVGIALNQDLYLGGVKNNRIEIASRQYDLQAQYLKEMMEQKDLEVMDRYRKTAELKSSIELKKELLEIYREKLTIEEKKLNEGNISQLDLLKTRTLINTTQIEYELLKVEYLSSYYKLLYITGNLRTELET